MQSREAEPLKFECTCGKVFTQFARFVAHWQRHGGQPRVQRVPVTAIDWSSGQVVIYRAAAVTPEPEGVTA